MLNNETEQFNFQDIEVWAMNEAAQLCHEHYINEPRADGTTRFQHAQRIIDEVLVPTLGEISNGMRMAAYLHDRVAPFFEDVPQTGELQDKLKQEIEYLRTINPTVTEYALATAISAHHYEEAAEKWREDVKVAIEDPTTYPFIREQIESIALKAPIEGTLADRTRELSERLAKCITDGGNSIDHSILQWRPPLSDIDLMMETLDTWDIEGLLLKTAEVVDNLRHPNPNRPASAWRDAQELLSFYAPLLDLTGFTKLSALAYSEALRYINVDPEINQYVKPTEAQAIRNERAKVQHILGRRFSELRVDEYTTAESPTYDQAIRNSIVNTFGDQIEIFDRVKLPGSIMEKATHPDLVGYRIVVDDLGDLNDIAVKVRELINQMSFLPGVQPEHIRPDDPVVEISLDITHPSRIEDRTRDAMEEAIGVPCRITGARGFRNNYEAIHVSFSFEQLTRLAPEELLKKYAIPKIGIELQIMDRNMYRKAQIGEASHIFYKSKNALGWFGEMTRLVNGLTEGPLVENYRTKVQLLKQIFANAYQRSNEYRTEKEAYSIQHEVANEMRDKFGIEINWAIQNISRPVPPLQ